MEITELRKSVSAGAVEHGMCTEFEELRGGLDRQSFSIESKLQKPKDLCLVSSLGTASKQRSCADDGLASLIAFQLS